MQNDKINEKINVRRNYMIKELMKEGFIVPKSSVIRLLEREDTGRSECLNTIFVLKMQTSRKQKCSFFRQIPKSLYIKEWII